MKGPVKPLILTILIIIVLYAGTQLLSPKRSTMDKNGEALLFYCAAGIQIPVTQVVADYEAEHGRKIRLNFAGSGTLLSTLEVAQKGDLYLAGDSSYIEIGREKGLLAEAIPVAKLRPVIAVPKGNPKNIQNLADLLNEDLRLSLGAPEAASIGKQTQKLLESLGQWDAISEAARTQGVFKPTVNEVANDVKLGAVDAGIVWDATVMQYPELEAVPLEGSENFVQHITISVLTASTRVSEALHFARYLTARDKGLLTFADQGFPPVEGDVWADMPEILYYSGGVNRVAIEDLLKEFEAREGCLVKTVYNGCGILVGQMKLGDRPDAYHSCDVSFMREVTDLFYPAIDISKTPMVIVTQKGNPKNLLTLADLGGEGLRLGLANEQQSALGALTARMLKEEGVYDAVSKNVITNTPTADLLVNQLSTGALDAVIVYLANMTYQKENLDIVMIDIPAAMAIQTYAVGKESKYPNLMNRFITYLESSEQTTRYLDSGFERAVQE